MSFSSLSLPQLQAYGRRTTGEESSEIICCTFSLSGDLSIDMLRQSAFDVLSRSRIYLPGINVECSVQAIEASTLQGASERMAKAQLLASSACALALVSIDQRKWLVAVSRAWVFDADGLSLFVVQALEQMSSGACGYEGRICYADYMNWQHELMASPEAQFGKQFWTRAAASFEPLLELPIEERLKAPFATSATFSTCALSEALGQRLDSIAARLQVSAQSLVLSAWLVVLERLLPERSKDLIVVLSNREEMFEHLVGRLDYELPVTFEVSSSTSFAGLAKHVFKKLDECGEWKECFFEQHLAIDADRQNIRFSTRTLRTGQSRELSWEEHPHACFAPSSHLEVTFARGARAHLVMSANPARYSQATVDFLLDELHDILTRAISDVSVQVGQLNVADLQADGWMVSRRRGHTEHALMMVDDRIRNVIEQQGQQIALDYGAQAWTYAELGELVSEQAQALRDIGIGIEDCVGLSVADPVRYLIGALAVWRVGAHFVALGEHVPAVRRQHIIDSSKVKAIIEIDGGVRAQSALGATTPRAQARRWPLDVLAYIICTSGTTGEPRAVAVSQRALANQVEALTRHFPLMPGERVLGRTPATFDASLWEWVLTFCRGARLHLLNVVDGASERAVIAALEAFPFHIVQMTPSLLSRCLHAGGAPALAKVAHVVIGGEALPGTFVAALAQHGGSLINAYGPAETCINASLYRTTDDVHSRTVPIGEPLDEYVFYVVDTACRPTPVAGIGMLCIGGAGLARGLVGASAATARHFVPDPFTSCAGARMYVTGDWVRRLPNGTIEFVGRQDDQMKLNGVRIDRAEIIAAINAEPGVKQATLIKLSEPLPCLVAFVVPVSPNHFSVEALSAALRVKLPMSMCPARIVVLADLALDPHGKVDQQVLRDLAQADRQSEFVAPRTPTEALVAKCWCSVLEIEQVGVHDNFFMSGGHSLSFSRLIVALREAFGISLSLGSVIDAPSVASLARHIDEQLNRGV
ncbi:non-ribosomal peptide synthase [Pseudomonas asplenii]|uniref:Non-ribosomal peptide synthase n=1 Tax=Pseudomonas asplenii TaxID=53407 RepID=A0A0N0E3P3_9PSED|nr:amino acid adenylation domain-containing protein [Pseudomonas fuscovaginae]KPA90322.1 non-ribosomal peptide synthase [Pseudomonas fuscovaginae]